MRGDWREVGGGREEDRGPRTKDTEDGETRQRMDDEQMMRVIPVDRIE